MQKKIMYVGVIAFLLFAISCLVPATANCQGDSWYRPNQTATMGWDEVTTTVNEDGTVGPLPEGAVVYYMTYIKNEVTGELFLASPQVADLQYTFTFPGNARWRGCVRAAMEIPGDEDADPILSVEMACSDNPDDCTNAETFGWITWNELSKVQGLRRVIP